jgi:uncharacterized protein YndB with AHSA1/START domain
MKKWLLRIALAVLVCIVAVLGYAFTLPSQVHVEREIEINAPPAIVFEEINDLHRWPNWEPWGTEYDSTVEHVYIGPDSGKNAQRTWQGEKVKTGRQVIVASEPPRRVAQEVWFDGSGPTQSEFNINAFGTGVRVKWSFDIDLGNVNPIPRLFASQMDSGLGADFERGLTKLKEVAEKRAREAKQEPPKTDTVEVPADDRQDFSGEE